MQKKLTRLSVNKPTTDRVLNLWSNLNTKNKREFTKSIKSLRNIPLSIREYTPRRKSLKKLLPLPRSRQTTPQPESPPARPRKKTLSKRTSIS